MLGEPELSQLRFPLCLSLRNPQPNDNTPCASSAEALQQTAHIQLQAVAASNGSRAP